IAETELFGQLDARNQRLLAFSAQWYEACEGQVVFGIDQVADAAYLCLSGEAELRWPASAAVDAPISVVSPGRLVGDLSIISRTPRQLDLVATQPSTFLRFGAEEFRAVIESDVTVAVQLLEVVAGHLGSAAEMVRQARVAQADRVETDDAPVSLETLADHLEGSDAPRS
ncbi:MAG: Crp/Fnr family transcriptional regulator, partial [Sedimentitalea sp.]